MKVTEEYIERELVLFLSFKRNFRYELKQDFRKIISLGVTYLFTKYKV